MPSSYRTALLALLAPTSLAAQDNPFHLTGGSVKSAYIVYEMTSKQQPGVGATYEIGVTPDRWIMRMVTPFEMAGKKDTMTMLTATSGDSQYTYTKTGSQPGDGEVSRTLRSYLAREYAALDAAGRARFKENLKLVGKLSGSDSWGVVGEFITLTGEKKGSETVGGHKCDVYQRGATSACVLPQAPLVMLRWTDEEQGLVVVAKKITLNGRVPAAAAVLPKGVRWKKKAYDDAEFGPEIWELKKQSDPATVSPATLAKFAVGYLASPGAAAELREAGGGTGGDEGTPTDEAAEENDESAP